MKKSILLGLSLLSFSAHAQNESLNKNINWEDISSTPTVSEESIDKKLSEKSNNTEKELNNAENSLTTDLNLDFLEDKQDERIFNNFKTTLRILNRQNDFVKNYELTPNKVLSLKGYNIEVESCAYVNINNVKNDLAYLKITQEDKVLYSGWMSNINKSLSYPELRLLYITLLSCEKLEPSDKKSDK